MASATSPELGEDHAMMLLIPLGATEQHGPHLPLGTDTMIATVWAQRTAIGLRTAGVAAVVAPALPYGSSGEHQTFPGTLSIGQDALELVVVELIRSAATDFDRIVLLSGHAGNLGPVTRAANQMIHEGHDVVQLFPTWLPDDVETIDAHAGRTETSLMLHLDPGLVRIDQMAPGQTRPLSQILGAMLADGVSAVSESGVLGDPTSASAAEGEHLLDLLVIRTIERLLGPSARCSKK